MILRSPFTPPFFLFQRICLLSLLILFHTNINAKSYFLTGLGLQFDLGNMGETITKDGINSGQYFSVQSSNSCNPSTEGCSSNGRTGGVALRRLVIPENRLITIARTTGGVFQADSTQGAMVGGNLIVGFEKDFGKYFFWRISGNYTQKIAGGVTKASFLGYRFIDANWNFQSIILPATIGIKMEVSEDTAIYMGVGLNYYTGGWGLRGRNDSKSVADTLDILSVSVPQLSLVRDLLRDGPDPTAVRENTQFRISGFSPHWLFGTQARITDKGHIFLEVETVFASKYDSTSSKSLGTILNLSPTPAFPIQLGGQVFRAGYKHEL
ncbi:porin OmpL1 [Leptospira stimsonii]|uniref:Porin OmpL1 n=1 Tax=Leptospira stimsonii TaxID=2202203 RepID=A0A396ZID2_9LEPT|nr:porin OmpL1 [Leptospira stimsonii]RHX92940.1 porin OmpL1 [Leptospira stimsonii]